MLAVAAFGFTANSHADAIGVYVQANLGQASASQSKAIKKYVRELKKDFDSTKSDKKDTAYKLAVGYKVIDYFAVELQYVDLGEASYKGLDSWENEKLTSETQGFGINAMGILPLGDFSLNAKLGVHQMKNKVNSKWGKIIGHAENDSKTIKKISPSIGIGASYNVVAGLSIGLDYERYMNVANKKAKLYEDEHEGKLNFKHDIDFVSLALRYSF